MGRSTCGFLLLCVLLSSPLFAAPKEGDFSSGWNTWAAAKEGDWAEYAMSLGGTIFHEVVKVEGKQITVRSTTVVADGQPLVQEKARNWEKHKLPGKPQKEAVWGDEEVEVCGEKRAVKVASWQTGGGDEVMTTRLVFCADVPCGGMVSMGMNNETTVWLTAWGKADGSGVGARLPAFYAGKGNVAVHKVSLSGVQQYWRTEVLEVRGRGVTVRRAQCDVNGKILANVKYEDEFTSADELVAKLGDALKSDVKIKVAAGEYTCTEHSATDFGAKLTVWVNPDGLVVKGQGANGLPPTIELVKLETAK